MALFGRSISLALVKPDAKNALESISSGGGAGGNVKKALSANEANTISIIMTTLMPSMFNLFSNITPDAYKAQFRDPCRFDPLMDIFKQLPPFFDRIATKYPTQPDLVAYYSMQLASTFLVNNGSLTMACLYNMLSLQTRLMTFSMDIMDNPEGNPALVGLFGIFMKPVMGMLKKNAMMQIIEHVDRYDKNDDLSNVSLFNFLNVVYCLVGLVGIVSNVFLVVLLRRSAVVVERAKNLVKLKMKQKSVAASKSATKTTTTTSAALAIVKPQESSLKLKPTTGQKPEMRSKKRVINTAWVILIKSNLKKAFSNRYDKNDAFLSS